MQFLTFLGWSNSKRPFAKCAKSSACGNNAATPSRRQTSRKRGCCRRTTRHESVADTEKWRVRNRKGDDMYALYDVWVFYCIVSSRRGWNREVLAAKLCMVTWLQKGGCFGTGCLIFGEWGFRELLNATRLPPLRSPIEIKCWYDLYSHIFCPSG